VIKIWGRNTSSNVQKVMWAVGEIGLSHERIDIGAPSLYVFDVRADTPFRRRAPAVERRDKLAA